MNPYDFNIFNKSRVDLIKHTYTLWPLYRNNLASTTRVQALSSLLNTVHQMPASVHWAMYTRCIDMMGTDRQRN